MNTCVQQHFNDNVNEIRHLLRLQDEPYTVVTDLQAHTLLMANTPEFMNQLKKVYREWVNNEKWVISPEKKIIKTPGINGDFRVMPCITDLGGRIKAVKVIGTNEENKTIKDKISVGKMLLLDWHDNYVYAMLDACVLSSYRTAAISLLAFSLLTKHGQENPGIIGMGRIGFYTAYILHHWLGIKTINCYDTNPQIIKKFQRLVSLYAPALQVHIMTNKTVIKQSTSIFLATDSETAILNAESSQHINFISSVGADADNLSELHESIIIGRKVVTDSIQSMLLGDMKVWHNKSLLLKEDVLELKDIIATSDRSQNHRPQSNSLFISTGVALQDAIISEFLVDKVNGNG